MNAVVKLSNFRNQTKGGKKKNLLTNAFKVFFSGKIGCLTSEGKTAAWRLLKRKYPTINESTTKNFNKDNSNDTNNSQIYLVLTNFV